jgi:hypothetical protein
VDYRYSFLAVLEALRSRDWKIFLVRVCFLVYGWWLLSMPPHGRETVSSTS